MDNEHRCILLMAFWMHIDTVTRSWGPLLSHSSTTITSCCSMIMHGQHTHRTCHSLSMFGMLWQPDQLYAKEMCCTAWGKWWSHQILTGTATDPPPPHTHTHFRVASFCGQPKAHLCNNHAVYSASWYATPVRWMDYLVKGEVLTNTDLDRFVNNIWDKYRPFVYIEKVLDLWVQLMKKKAKTKVLHL